jgi:hypothetical protein
MPIARRTLGSGMPVLPARILTVRGSLTPIY